MLSLNRPKAKKRLNIQSLFLFDFFPPGCVKHSKTSPIVSPIIKASTERVSESHKGAREWQKVLTIEDKPGAASTANGHA